MADYSHEVCFTCRKSWAPRAQRRHVIAWKDGRCCPDCGGELTGLGLRFKPPKQRNKKEWKRLEVLARAGEKFVKF